jgi:hypothetical protein
MFLVHFVGLVLDAAIFGVILASMTGEFPGWGTLIGSVLVVGIVSNLVGALFPWPLSLVGLVAGAAAGATVISWVTEVDFRRAVKAAAVYLGVRLVLTILLMAILH